MADYNISASITADTSGYESGVKKAQTASNKLSKSITNVVKGFGKSGLSGAITSAGLALGGIGLAVGVAVKAIKGITKALGECAEAYKTQLIAEKALDTAINNSPYVSGTASKALKDFASEMQKISNLGDEEIIPQMTQLIATGRTEAEVMKIIKTATDMSASGLISFDTAVTQLNATLNGNVGRLGQQNAELKSLSEEELKNGKAVDILAEKYKGLAEASIDSSKQLKNALGDLKETFGKSFEDAMTPMRQFFTEMIQGWADARKAKQEYEKSEEAVNTGNATITDLQNVIKEREKALSELKQELQELQAGGSDWAEIFKEDIALTKTRIKQAENELGILNAKLANRQREQEQADKIAKQEAERHKAEAEAIEREQKVVELKEEYLKKIAEQEVKWKNIRAVTGEEVSNEEKIKFYQDSLVDLMTQAGGQITTNNQLYKDQIAIIQKLQSELKPETSDTWNKKLRDQAIARLEAEKQAQIQSEEFAEKTAEERYKIESKYNDSILRLKWDRLVEEREIALQSIKGVENEEEEKTRIVEYYSNELSDLLKEYSTEFEEAGENASQSFADGFKSVIKKLTPIMKEIGNVLSRIGKIAKGLFKGGKSIFAKLFELNLDSALDGLLKIEDKILTFFVETLPRLPQFFASAMQSVSVLIESVLNIVTPERISEIIISILQTIQQYAPTIIGAIADILSNMLDGIVNSLPQIIDTLNVVVEKLAEVLPQLIQKLIDLFIGILQNPDKIAQLVVTIIKGIVEIFNVLLRNIGPLLEALLPAIGTIIIELIKAIPDLLSSMGEALSEAIKGIGKFIVNMIIDVLNLMFDGISKAWTWIPGAKGIPHIPHLATGTDNAQRGIALVGEAGPELVRFNGGEQVLNNRNTQKALAGIGNSGNTFNVTFNNTQDTTAFAMMSQLRQYNRELAINGVI